MPSTEIGSRPTAIELAAAKVLLEPWRWLTSPRFSGLDHLPRDRPVMVAANHTLMGVLDAPLLVLGLHDRTGVFLRALGDHLHFRIPLWRDLLTHFGTVDGTRENCRALLRAGESILVFPGGAREVFKHKHEKYQLIWKERVGFVRLAVQFGVPLVPLAAVGAEECYDILVDSDELLHTPIGPLLRQLSSRPDEIPPLVAGIGPLPRPERFYFHVGRPIETAAFRGQQKDDALCLRLRERVRRAIQRGLRQLLEERERDPDRSLRARVVGTSRAATRSETPTPSRARRARPRVP